jgi:hypothetical protein
VSELLFVSVVFYVLGIVGSITLGFFGLDLAKEFNTPKDRAMGFKLIRLSWAWPLLVTEMLRKIYRDAKEAESNERG